MRQAEREIEKAQRQAEKASQRAERRAQRAQERAQRRATKFQAKYERKWGTHARGTHAPKAARQGPSHEEQLAVLKMLQEGKVSVEEAETLLKAMGA
jgi:hypothetical protein